MVKINIDFSRYADYPLVNSKFGVYICTYVDIERTLRDMPLLKALHPYGLRYDPGCGFGNDDKLNSPREYNAPQITLENDEILIHFEDYDRMVDALQNTSVRKMYVNAYNPPCLQDDKARLEGNMSLGMRSRWNTMPSDMGRWQEINRKYANHFQQKDRHFQYFEIWNEPDLKPVFFTGTMEQYFELYRYGANGVKEGNPEAKVGGPVIANTAAGHPEITDHADWAEQFLDFVEREKLPLDFFSYHNYASPEEIVPLMRKAIRNRKGMETVETVMSEYNSYHPGTPEFSVGGKIERHHLACHLLDDFKFFVEQPDLTCVYWAQFNDPEVFGDGVDRCGLLSLDGEKKAAYHALDIFSRLPADRVTLFSDSEVVDGFASVQGKKAAFVIWNKSGKEEDVKICLDNLPFSSGCAQVYKIDAWRNSRIDNLNDPGLRCNETVAVDNHSLCIKDTMLGESVYYVELHSTEKQEKSEDMDDFPDCDVTHYYFDRFLTNYAEYDVKEHAAYLGMGKEKVATSQMKMVFSGPVAGALVEGRDISESSEGALQIDVTKYQSNGDKQTDVRILDAETFLKGRLTFDFNDGKDVVQTEIICTMRNMNPSAKVKLTFSC